MKIKHILAALSAAVIAAVSFSGCAVAEIEMALECAAVPHIEKDSVFIKDFEENKSLFLEQNVSYKSDKNAKSKLDGFMKKLKESDYTMRECTYNIDYRFDYFYYYAFPYGNLDDASGVGFEEVIRSDDNYKYVSGSYPVENGSPILDKKTEYGTYSEEIFVGGHNYFRRAMENDFYIDSHSGFTTMTNSLEYIWLFDVISSGTVSIGGKEYKADLMCMADKYTYVYSDEGYDYSNEDLEMVYVDDNSIYQNALYEPMEYVVAYDENGNVFAIFERENGNIFPNGIRTLIVFEQNEDNSDKVQVPKEYYRYTSTADLS